MRWQKSYNDQNHTSWEETEYGIINEITITFLHLFLHFCISFYLLLNRCRILILCCRGHFAPRQGNPRTMEATLRGLRNEMAPPTENVVEINSNHMISTYVYQYIPWASEPWKNVGCSSKPEVWKQNPRFSKFMKFNYLIVCVKYQ